MFATPIKADALLATGLGVLRTIRQTVRIPLVGIGGITSTNAGDVICAGADGVAVVSAIIPIQNPGAAARALRSAIE